MSQGSHQIQTQAQQLTQTLSPQQILVVKLLELPTMELEERVRAEILDNPALEEGKDISDQDHSEEFEDNFNEDNSYINEDISLGDYRTEDDIPDYKLQEHNRSRGEIAEEIPFSDSVSFYEMLLEQLRMQHLTEEEKIMAEYLIGSLDDDGLLRKGTQTLIDELAIYRGIYTNENKINQVLSVIQDFDPAGIGARSLQECLLLQLNHKEQTPAVELARTIIQHHFETFSRRNYSKLLQRLTISEEQLKKATEEIVHLNPRPGSAWIGTVVERNQSIVIPDFEVKQEDDELVITLNHGSISELHVSKEYQQMLEKYSKLESNNSAKIREAVRFVKTNIDNAKYFIDAIRQRNETMMRTIEVLVALQRDFFLQGDSIYLKPLTLKDVADRTGYDISTISRTFANKYVQTEFGIFPLKYFFSDKIVNTQGAEVSTREIKQKLREVIEQEDKSNPVTDDQLVEIMHSAGYPIARRTVAKYREQMGIPVARMRRQMT